MQGARLGTREIIGNEQMSGVILKMDRGWADDETQMRKDELPRDRKKGENTKRVGSRKGAQKSAWCRMNAVEEAD